MSFRAPRGVRSVSVSDTGKTTVDGIDQVGNNLTHTIVWCNVHVCPARLYEDGSFDCWHDCTVGWSPHQHVLGVDIVEGPWEQS